jgi:hypothetical protein
VCGYRRYLRLRRKSGLLRCRVGSLAIRYRDHSRTCTCFRSATPYGSMMTTLSARNALHRPGMLIRRAESRNLRTATPQALSWIDAVVKVLSNQRLTTSWLPAANLCFLWAANLWLPPHPGQVDAISVQTGSCMAHGRGDAECFLWERPCRDCLSPRRSRPWPLPRQSGIRQSFR